MRYLISLFIALLALPIFGETLPDAPAAGSSSAGAIAYEAPVQTTGFLAAKAPAHHFFDRANNIRFIALASLVATDGYTTQIALNGSSRFREVNPLARPFVSHGAAGQVAASAIGLGAATGTAYLLHKTGHHKIERFVLNASIGVEAETVSSNAWYLIH
jgi:hypothetical protein